MLGLPLVPLIESWPATSATAEALIVRRRGDRVVFLSNLRKESSTALTKTLSLSDRNATAVMAVLGTKGAFEGIDYAEVSRSSGHKLHETRCSRMQQF